MSEPQLETAAEKMNLKHIQVAKEDIEKELGELKTAIEKGFVPANNRIVQDLLKVYDHLKHNGVVIDLFESFRETGTDDNMDPKLAIVRADAQGKECTVYKYNNGSGLFSQERKRQYTVSVSRGLGDIRTPPGTFKWNNYEHGPQLRFRKCAVPIIPPRINLAVSVRIIPQYYYILFEPQTWVTYRAKPRAPRDPILGKMLTKNLFGVLATWDLTDLEMKIIEGL